MSHNRTHTHIAATGVKTRALAAEAEKSSSSTMRAAAVAGAVRVLSHAYIEGQLIVETTCTDFDYYKALPDAISYMGRELGKMGWSSDTNRCCYKSGVPIAHKVR